jgi:hypothetical protein
MRRIDYYPSKDAPVVIEQTWGTRQGAISRSSLTGLHWRRRYSGINKRRVDW